MSLVRQGAFLGALAEALGLPKEALRVQAAEVKSAQLAESHLRIARHLSAQAIYRPSPVHCSEGAHGTQDCTLRFLCKILG